MPEIKELLAAVNQNNETLAEIEGELTDLRVEISNLPDKYIPRFEAKEKANKIQKVAAAGASVFFILGIIVFAFVLYVRDESEEACRSNREALRNVITIAVADRQPLATSSPETVAAIEEVNTRQIRPLRERLLSLEGTQPEKC